MQGNEKKEKAIAGLQKETTQEMLAHTLTVISRCMKADGQIIIAVDPPKGDEQIRLEAIKTEDGRSWWAAFTSFEEELKGSDTTKIINHSEQTTATISYSTNAISYLTNLSRRLEDYLII